MQLSAMSDEQVQEAFREAIREVYEGREPVCRNLLVESESSRLEGFHSFFEMIEEAWTQRGELEVTGRDASLIALFEQFYAHANTAYVTFCRRTDGSVRATAFQINDQKGSAGMALC